MKRGLILGFFDGVHTAHQAVIKSALDYAGEAMLITFKDSPAKYFNQEAEYIYTRKQSLKKIMSLGVSEVIELNFAEIADMPADEYLKFIVQNIIQYQFPPATTILSGKTGAEILIFWQRMQINSDTNIYAYLLRCLMTKL